ncbi:putative global transcription activator SNF2L1 [Frankliniella fusca]|uniref:Global transcription activator SNF2L1 n=1 Tax=Frankliniella fusca TaxID=407009 RepID=A0AAE1HHP4_9NEOP|nr:putative global transcription activator SNF2L1 [Frankliniella fusca]
MGIVGKLDGKVTKMLERKETRVKRQATFLNESMAKKHCPTLSVVPEEFECQDDLPVDTKDSEFHVSERTRRSISNKNKRQGTFKVTAKVADRFQLPNGAVAAIATAVLEDKGLVSPEDKSLVVDINKVRRDREKVRKETQKSSNTSPILGLYFDGKSDSTMKMEKRGDTYHRVTVAEEHISLVQEPGGEYLDHLASAKSAKASMASMIKYCQDKNINLEQLEVIGCDGTATNTGHKSGIAMLLEKHLGRSLRWQICLLHFNELPLRHLITETDGPTSGPKCFQGPIGSQLKNCETLPVVAFTPIESDPISVDRNLLRTDQKYLYDMCAAVSSGDVSSSVESRKPGPLNHARWLTAACRILRLYVATETPSEDLKTLTEFIVKVYAQVWFAIKTQWHFYNSSLHVWKAIKLSRYLPRK